MKTLSQLKRNALLILTALATCAAHAQNEALPGDFFPPAFRALANSESAYWSDSFTNAFNGPNHATAPAPGGATIANATVTQTTPGAFIIGSPAGDIYSFSSTNTFVLNYSISNTSVYSNGIGGIVFRAETDGSELDYSSVVIVYTNCFGPQIVPAARNEIYLDIADSPFGPTADVVSEWQWPGLPEGISSFAIIFNGSDTSVALEQVMLDVTPALPPAAGPFACDSVTANLTRWVYPFNQNPAARSTASTFAAFGNTGSFDTRDGQYLIGWNTSSNIPSGQGAKNYLLSRARVTLTISSDLVYAYDGTLRDYRTYFPTNDLRYLATTDTGSPVELYGVGFRGGLANTNGGSIAYNTLNYPQAGPFGVVTNGGDFTNRVAYAAGYETNGLLVDVSNNVGDDGTNELAHPFEVSPFAVGLNPNFTVGQLMPAGSQLTFDLDLNNPLIYGYVQQALNQGNLSFVATSLINANFFSGAPNWPDFYTLFNVLAASNQYPLLTVEGSVVRPCLDADNDGLPDDWERFYFGTLGAGAANSPTGDGVSNLAKYIAGTDPTTAANNLRVESVIRKINGAEIHFTFAPSRQYTIQWSSNLTTWQTVTNPTLQYTSAWLAKTGTNLVYPTPVHAVWLDTNAVTQQRFYRIGVH